jgi:hypothetical protein
VYYSGTISALKLTICEKLGILEARFEKFEEGKVASPAYLLWMCDEVLKMDSTSIDEAVKAGRWMGWVFAHVEILGIWTNTETRNHVREDRRLGLDKPHPS